MNPKITPVFNRTTQKIHLLIGVISREDALLKTWLESIAVLDTTVIQLDIFVFANHESPHAQHQLKNANIHYLVLEKGRPFLQIAPARSYLQARILAFCQDLKHEFFVWLLDEDVIIDHTANTYLLELPALKQQGFDVLIGAIEGDSPNAAFSGMQLQLSDLLANIKWLKTLNESDILPNRGDSNQTYREKYPDYYYDLTSKHQGHLACNFWLTADYAGETVGQARRRMYRHLEDILSGKNLFRALVADKNSPPEATLLRGPNTFILNIDTLKIANPAITMAGTVLRRSDMLWALINQKFHHRRIAKVGFSVKHCRPISVTQELTVDKTVQENCGSIVFNALRIFLDKENADFASVLRTQIDAKLTAIESSIKHTKIIIEQLEALHIPELKQFCQTLRAFYVAENEVQIIQKIKQLSVHQEQILSQFLSHVPLIKNHCALHNQHGVFQQYDLGDDWIKLFSKKPIEKMDKTVPPLVRIHDACANSEVFSATDCDCASQLNQAFKVIHQHDNGLIFYLDQEGRGHGYAKKIAIVGAMQNHQIDTYEACQQLHLEPDVRDYQAVADVLKKLGFLKIKLLSNNPKKRQKLEKCGIEVVRQAINSKPTHKNIDYLISKQEKAQHSNLVITEKQLNRLYPPSKNAIVFYQKNEEYGEFSNFSDYGFALEDRYWRTSEHYYQAQKFHQHPELFSQIQQAKTPVLAKQIAQDNARHVPKNWHQHQIVFMSNALGAKFEQNPKLKALLLSTESHYLLENAPDDAFWGCGKSGEGRNMLGKLLMHWRDTFQANDGQNPNEE